MWNLKKHRTIALYLLGRGVKWEILSKLLEGLHGVAIGAQKHKSIKKFGLGPHSRYATLPPSRFSIFYNFNTANSEKIKNDQKGVVF